MATKQSVLTLRGFFPFLLAVILFAAAGCSGENKGEPPMEKTATPAPTFDKSGKPMQGPPPGMPGR
jgi:hypothetical protein